jgi:Nif-specific regulatory protein
MKELPKVLIVDDEIGIRESLRMVLKDEYEVLLASSGHEAAELVAKEAPQLVILDIIMPGMDGLETLQKIRESNDEILVIMLSAVKTIKMVVEAMKLGAEDYLAKPFDVSEIKIVVNRALEKTLLKKEVNHLRHEVSERYGFGNIVGKTKAMRRIYETIQQIANKKTTVLIQGESGTGKELIAKAIHYNSARRSRPFVTVNCAAIPETLIESEMFGHEKGAFTDAYFKKTGQFETADGGTLFLDEIGELSPITQAKLLRVLQEREFLRVGGVKKVSVDVRLIAATNKQLEVAIKEGNFRSDLYYRINVVPILIPPLRERKEDIPILVEHFTRKYAEKSRKVRFSKEASDLLNQYDWPGNVRELENTVERSLALSKEDMIDPEVLPANIQQNGSIIMIREEVLTGKIPYESAVQEFEKNILLAALKKANFVQVRAADILGISRRVLKYKVDKYSIDIDQLANSEQ